MFIRVYVFPCSCSSVSKSLQCPFRCISLRMYAHPSVCPSLCMTVHVYFPSVCIYPPRMSLCGSPLSVCLSLCMSSPRKYPLRVHVPSMWCPFRVFFFVWLFLHVYVTSMYAPPSLRHFVYKFHPCVCPSMCISPLSVCPSVCMFLRMIVVGIRTSRTKGWCGRSVGYTS